MKFILSNNLFIIIIINKIIKWKYIIVRFVLKILIKHIILFVVHQNINIFYVINVIKIGNIVVKNQKQILLVQFVELLLNLSLKIMMVILILILMMKMLLRLL